MNSLYKMLPTPCNADATAYAYLHSQGENLARDKDMSVNLSLREAAYISRTHPKALSVSGSFFIAKETFIQVGAIFFRAF